MLPLPKCKIVFRLLINTAITDGLGGKKIASHFLPASARQRNKSVLDSDELHLSKFNIYFENRGLGLGWAFAAASPRFILLKFWIREFKREGLPEPGLAAEVLFGTEAEFELIPVELNACLCNELVLVKIYREKRLGGVWKRARIFWHRINL